MGLNIIIRKITGVEEYEDDLTGYTDKYYTTEVVDWWDSLRRSGDKEFVLNNRFVDVGEDDNDFEREYCRPEDFNACREFIKSNIVDSNQERLLNAMDKMEADEKLVFKFSW